MSAPACARRHRRLARRWCSRARIRPARVPVDARDHLCRRIRRRRGQPAPSPGHARRVSELVRRAPPRPSGPRRAAAFAGSSPAAKIPRCASSTPAPLQLPPPCCPCQECRSASGNGRQVDAHHTVCVGHGQDGSHVHRRLPGADRLRGPGQPLGQRRRLHPRRAAAPPARGCSPSASAESGRRSSTTRCAAWSATVSCSVAGTPKRRPASTTS